MIIGFFYVDYYWQTRVIGIITKYIFCCSSQRQNIGLPFGVLWLNSNETYSSEFKEKKVDISQEWWGAGQIKGNPEKTDLG